MKFFSGKHKTRAAIARTAATILLSMLPLAYTGNGDSAETDGNGHIQWSTRIRMIRRTVVRWS